MTSFTLTFSTRQMLLFDVHFTDGRKKKGILHLGVVAILDSTWRRSSYRFLLVLHYFICNTDHGDCTDNNNPPSCDSYHIRFSKTSNHRFLHVSIFKLVVIVLLKTEWCRSTDRYLPVIFFTWYSYHGVCKEKVVRHLGAVAILDSIWRHCPKVKLVCKLLAQTVD